MPALGVPIYSSSEPHFAECILISALGGICAYLQDNARHPDAENELITVVSDDNAHCHPDDNKENEPPKDGDAWDQVPEGERPSVQTVDPAFLREQSRNSKMWEQWEKTGAAPKWEDGDKADW